ncbi:bifunctional phosphopantothenoylcysteine decarboxylase/phosphopantothenate--cysteine ligase CoaBC [Persicimonas caeni]|jgi:phosphopantothenoylcysteine decarboxylase/phosphopantothenate--cysteine ligase|uniref:Coenzyme A biosynthesis bifunctional protein CoaBC n=1 Tax=Persicimonas caeni TaxID=2292766 RepID=A0A4Y6PUH3_PERCE|nr:bifunctional phosphopantothenoylcysteine decarboxylase/phosphopantothenate--cysteine ligase CoaBC [Persicimonas caeni]QDG51981.1 bifunctional phosphopantothenoylcysteine decarboxylase/phosphopantothenate--cysteine ligase CoaBC [Persicimonas caeni]QED33202.1 bifunctional phosphopantothenoylcysteine decarboxylase/phosphopantothenate--cysteine ligase CoaBC [Persicimonas caeni]
MNILIGISGGIAAYKACEIVRAFKKRGDDVRAVMTSGAQEFVRPLTLQILTENTVGTETFDATFESEIGHIDLARWADVVLIAPATANLVARMAAGMANDLLTTIILATTAPVVVAPSMNTQMWFNPLVQRNLRTLADEAGYLVVDPDSGELACKEVGPGRLPDPPVLLDMVDAAVAPKILADKKVVVTAGPTREHIDPARFISNPSTGRMGYALARAASAFGADVVLVSGPTTLDAPAGVRLVEVTGARQMHEAVMAEADSADFIVKAAAVGDFRPKQASDQKVEKGAMAGKLELERNPDILAELGQKYGARTDGPLVVGFAAESFDVVERGKAKRERKGAHMMVANKIGGARSAFGADESQVAVISDRGVTEYGPASKDALSREIWREAVALANSRTGEEDGR